MASVKLYNYLQKYDTIEVGSLIGKEYEVLTISIPEGHRGYNVDKHPEYAVFTVTDSKGREVIINKNTCLQVLSYVYFPPEFLKDGISITNIVQITKTQIDNETIYVDRYLSNSSYNNNYLAKWLKQFSNYTFAHSETNPIACKENVEACIRLANSNKKADLVLWQTK